MVNTTSQSSASGKTPRTNTSNPSDTETGLGPLPNDGRNMKKHAGFYFDPKHPNHRGERQRIIREIAELVGHRKDPYTSKGTMTASHLYTISKQLGFPRHVKERHKIINRLIDHLGIETNQSFNCMDTRLAMDELKQLKTALGKTI